MSEPNTIPRFTIAPLEKGQQVSVANTSRTTGTTVTPIVVPSQAGAIVTLVAAKAAGTTTAGILYWWIGQGGTWRLIGETIVAAITASGTVASWEGSWTPPGGSLTLGPGNQLGCSTYVAETFNLFPEGGHFAMPES